MDHDVGISVPVLRFNTLHRLNTKNWCWFKLSPQNADGAPMLKILCGMIAFGNSLGVFGGSGIPQGPTEPQSFIANTRTTSGAGWTNEFHVYDVSEGIVCKYKFISIPGYIIYYTRCVELSCHNRRETTSMCNFHFHCS